MDADLEKYCRAQLAAVRAQKLVPTTGERNLQLLSVGHNGISASSSFRSESSNDERNKIGEAIC